MLTTVEGIMLLGYAVGALVAMGNLRAMAWLGLGAAVFTASSVYWRTGLPHPELVAGAFDTIVCLTIYFAGRERWEMWIWRLFQVMLMLNIIRLAGTVGIYPNADHGTYAVLLEVTNWLVILLISGTAGLQRIGYGYGGAADPWHRVSGLVRALHAQRSRPPFTARKA